MDLLQLKPHRRNGVAPSLEMLPREIPFPAPQSGYRDRTLPFQKSDNRNHWMFGRSSSYLEEETPGTVKPVQVSLVEPVAYPKQL